jgi:hypothetical protein
MLVRPLDHAMNIRSLKPSLLVALVVALIVGAIFSPRVLYIGIIMLLGTAFALGAFHHLLPVFSRRRAEAMRWGGSSSPRMSRLSLLLISALFGCGSAWIFQRGFATPRPDTHYLFIAIGSLIVLVFIGRWLDTGR